MMMTMIPSARVSCRKAKLPTTLVAVRAHPKLKLRFKSIIGLARGALGPLGDPAGNGAGPGIPLPRVTGKWPHPYQSNLGGL